MARVAGECAAAPSPLGALAGQRWFETCVRASSFTTTPRGALKTGEDEGGGADDEEEVERREEEDDEECETAEEDAVEEVCQAIE